MEMGSEGATRQDTSVSTRDVGAIRTGCSGWNYKHWRERFYPKGLPARRWFEFYAEHFDTVEINNSFYRLPSAETFDKWRQQAPPGFCYAVKANRYITQAKKLLDPEEPLERMMSAARHLESCLGPTSCINSLRALASTWSGWSSFSRFCRRT